MALHQRLVEFFMKDKDKKPAGLFGALLDVWKEMAGVFFSILPKVASFFFWVVVGIIVLPCVYVAGNIYPSWQKWGENL